jgi:hypothetical protein
LHPGKKGVRGWVREEEGEVRVEEKGGMGDDLSVSSNTVARKKDVQPREVGQKSLPRLAEIDRYPISNPSHYSIPKPRPIE